MTPKIAAIGEAMVEFAPVGEGLYRRGFAGDTFNTIWHMAQCLGREARCSFVTRVGSDALSDRFVHELSEDGLDVACISRDPARLMGLYMIELDGAERSFHYWRGQSAARHLADDPGALRDALRDSAIVYLSGITLAVLTPDGRRALFDVLAELRGQGARVAFDPNFRPKLWPSREAAREAMHQALRLSDIALPSFDDEQALWGDPTPEATVQRLIEAGVGEVVVKNGARGVTTVENGRVSVTETPPPETLRDTAGAGDAFNAGYLSASLKGAARSDAIAQGHRLACTVLATFGARASKEAVTELLRSV
ncbi:sugar kinase [Litorisediminicola beolgyonensis]|uniref:Sugar kinase n=1 Tax=Litorisediminicola beolgyonensis TaxID=1173614 RepID=A0ABW3ZHT6_9RHOB